MILSSSNSVFSNRFARGTDDNDSTNQDDHSLAKFSLPNDSQLSSEETDLGAQQHAQNALDSSRLIDASPVETLIQQLVENGTEFLHLLSHSAASSSAESLASPTNTTTGSSSSNDAMILVDEKAAELFPFDTILPMIVVALSVSFIVIGGAIPYVFQYAEIYRRKSAAGFSLLVCLALCIANILRIEFWIGKRFELPLLVQSIVMLAVMAAMLEISVRMNRRIVPLTARTSVWSESIFKKSFFFCHFALFK
uniref:Uncharacterized protein n=1 Tax=Globodera rostochiensis TaxID=31243 RepID=A0A914HEL0_GLORO